MKVRACQKKPPPREGEISAAIFLSALITRTSPRFSARIEASIFERSPATIQVKGLPDKARNKYGMVDAIAPFVGRKRNSIPAIMRESNQARSSITEASKE